MRKIQRPQDRVRVTSRWERRRRSRGTARCEWIVMQHAVRSSLPFIRNAQDNGACCVSSDGAKSEKSRNFKLAIVGGGPAGIGVWLDYVISVTEFVLRSSL